MEFTISETDILYLLVVLQSVFALSIYVMMGPATAIGYRTMIAENEAYELGVIMNNMMVTMVLGLVMLLFLQVIVFWFWKNVFRCYDFLTEDKREIPRRKRRSTESL